MPEEAGDSNFVSRLAAKWHALDHWLRAQTRERCVASSAREGQERRAVEGDNQAALFLVAPIDRPTGQRLTSSS
jgi:hypothetical protein